MEKRDDFDFDDIELAQREYEQGLLTVKSQFKDVKEKISHKRSRIETESEGLNNDSKRVKEDENKVLRRIPACNFISVTSQTRTRVYLRMKEPRIQRLNEQRKFGRAFGLLSSSFSDIRNQAEELLKKSHRENALENRERKPNSSHLWVDQFKPKSYLELLSDDGVNRSLLRWLRLWDKIVFNISHPTKPPPRVQPSKHQPWMIKKNWPQVNQDLDSNSFPLQRIALLTGPPGLGKTTLAHVIATHAGYNVIEMNASDDRSVEIFRTQIEASTQMRSVRDRRPNCLVIDEIDGAPAASINLLVAMTTGTSKDKKKDNGIRRPIICICNDQYAPSLKVLRQNALVIVFPPTLPSRLAGRLQEISVEKRMSVELTTLLVLCDKTDNDIRSCLSILQFINNNNNNNNNQPRNVTNNNITLTDIISHSIGQKDIQRTFFQIWTEIFTIPRKTDQSTTSATQPMSDKSTLSTRFTHILKIANSGGDIDKLYSGLFHNYLNLKFKKSTADPISESIEWLCFTDVIQTQIHSTQNYTLYPYTTLGFVIFNFLFASKTKPKIEYPSQQFEVISKQNRHLATRDSLLDQTKPSIRVYATPTTLLIEILPYLSIILQPTLRPVNTQLYTTLERQQLSSLINLMISYQITYIQQRSSDGTYNYVLYPNIEDVVNFGDNKVARVLTYAVKQLLSREIELESMRRKEPRVVDVDVDVETAKLKSQPTNEPSPTPPRKLRERPMVDFFGRPLVTKREDGPLERCRVGEEKSTCDLWFHFKEGYSNAVRRNIRILDLM